MASYGWLHKLGMLLYCWTPYWNFPWIQPALGGEGISYKVIIGLNCIFPKSLKLCIFLL